MTREEAKHILLNTAWLGGNNDKTEDAIGVAIKALEQEPKTGHWKEDENEMEVWCSECAEENDKCSKYCPNCGAKMKSEE